MFQQGSFTSKIVRSISSSQLYRLCEKDSVNALAKLWVFFAYFGFLARGFIT